MELLIGGMITVLALAGMLVLENWADIKRSRDRKWEEKINRRKIIV